MQPEDKALLERLNLLERQRTEAQDIVSRLYARHRMDEQAPALLDLANRLAGELERCERALNPRQWTQAMHDAWHKALPDTQAAFEALTKEALNPSPEPSHES